VSVSTDLELIPNLNADDPHHRGLRVFLRSYLLQAQYGIYGNGTLLVVWQGF
jgi:hypothetical protein